VRPVEREEKAKEGRFTVTTIRPCEMVKNAALETWISQDRKKRYSNDEGSSTKNGPRKWKMFRLSDGRVGGKFDGDTSGSDGTEFTVDDEQSQNEKETEAEGTADNREIEETTGTVGEATGQVDNLPGNDLKQKREKEHEDGYLWEKAQEQEEPAKLVSEAPPEAVRLPDEKWSTASSSSSGGDEGYSQWNKETVRQKVMQKVYLLEKWMHVQDLSTDSSTSSGEDDGYSRCTKGVFGRLLKERRDAKRKRRARMTEGDKERARQRNATYKRNFLYNVLVEREAQERAEEGAD
jgi:hypothetical protein